MNATDAVLFEEMLGPDGALGIITLNCPAVLNSLSTSMLQQMHATLKTWADADHIKAVVIRAAEGKAFCAGGNLRQIGEHTRQAKNHAMDFFRVEYQLNRYIFHFPKPYIALLDGITMGGGVGISIHGSHRVATENLLFAMPETGIGFYPDVGGTYFLPRLQGYIGYYLGLTGARIASDDCVALGIAQYKVPREQLSALLAELAQQAFTNDAHQAVTEIIKRYQVTHKPLSLSTQQHLIDTCFSGDTVEKILDALYAQQHEFCKETIATLAKKSPTSLVVTLRALQEGKQLDFDQCMRQEFRLTTRFIQGNDFMEGIRAVIIDKDQQPKWRPDQLVGVGNIDSYFEPLALELI